MIGGMIGLMVKFAQNHGISVSEQEREPRNWDVFFGAPMAIFTRFEVVIIYIYTYTYTYTYIYIHIYIHFTYVYVYIYIYVYIYVYNRNSTSHFMVIGDISWHISSNKAVAFQR